MTIQRHSIAGRGNSKCKGPASLAHPAHKSKEILKWLWNRNTVLLSPALKKRGLNIYENKRKHKRTKILNKI